MRYNCRPRREDKWDNLQLVITTALLSLSTEALSAHLRESRDMLKKNLFIWYFLDGASFI